MRNQEVAALLSRMALLLEANGESRFKSAAYQKAARVVGGLADDVEGLARAGGLRDLPGIGEGIAKNVEEYLATGRVEYLDRLERGVPEGAVALMAVPGIGPKTAFRLARDHGIRSVEVLRKELDSGGLRDALGKGASDRIRAEIETLQAGLGRVLLPEAEALAQDMVSYARSSGCTLEVAGSLRRGRETVGDIDLLSLDGRALEILGGYGNVARTLERGSRKGSYVLHNGLRVDLLVAERGGHGAAMMHFTGSREHNVAMRSLALGKGLRLNEYGLYEGGVRVAGETEEGVFSELGLQYIPPELREGRGEVEAAKDGHIPELVKGKDVRGDLQMHSRWSDGTAEIEAMATAAMEMGYEYVAITDHSFSARLAHGLSEERFKEQWKEVDRLNDRLAPFRVLKGVEAEVGGDGGLDFGREFLDEFDLVGVSMHQGYGQSAEKLTERAVRALSHPSVDYMCHPTNRLIGTRRGHMLDLRRVIAAARDSGVMLEIDAQPNRLDLDDVWSRKAAEEGVGMFIDSDAHSVDQLENVRFGVLTARRAWLEKKHVANTRGLKSLLRMLAR